MNLIDRDATKNHIKRRMCNNCEYYGAICNACDVQDALDAIDDMATIDAAPVVHGEWVNVVGGFFEMGRCSVCGGQWPTAGGLNFCPNCGAKMEVRDD